MFIHFSGTIINSDDILEVRYSSFAEEGWIHITSKFGKVYLVEGQEAFEVLVRLCPEALEGQNAEEQKGRWAIHNLLGHPLMQIFSWLGFTSLGLKIHDATVPNPITK